MQQKKESDKSQYSTCESTTDSDSKRKQEKRLTKEYKGCEITESIALNNRRNIISNNFMESTDSVRIEGEKLGLASFDQIKVIGRGAFGKVILVRKKCDQKLYAIKCLKKAHIIKTETLTKYKK